MLGPERCRRLGELLCRRTVAVASRFAERVVVGEPPAPGTRRAFVVSAEIPRLSVAHLACAAMDLDDGAGASFGATLDGGCYLLAMRESAPGLLAHGPGRPPDPMGLAKAMAAARDAGLEMGLVRMERRLREPADAAAMLADPLLPADVRRLLSGPK